MYVHELLRVHGGGGQNKFLQINKPYYNFHNLLGKYFLFWIQNFILSYKQDKKKYSWYFLFFFFHIYT